MAQDRYRSFRQTALGRALVALAEDPARYSEYAALSRVEVPAVAALVHDLKASFPEVAHNDFAKQAIGAFVGNVMRDNRHTKLGRARVPGGLFTYGNLWSALPQLVAVDAA